MKHHKNSKLSDFELTEFFNSYQQYKNQGLREGQSLYNALHDVKPELALAIVHSNDDPYFRDEYIGNFYKYIGIDIACI